MTGLPPELVSAVLAAPGQAAPRLACADWLDEHGDPDAATLVRLQVRLTRHAELRVPVREQNRLQAAADALVAANSGRWVLAPLGTDDPRGVTATFRDGFVTRLAVSIACRLPPEQVFGRLGAFPLLEEFRHRSRRRVPQSILQCLPHLPRLTSLSLNLTPPEWDAATVARLAGMVALVAVYQHNGPSSWRENWGPLREARLARLSETPTGELLAAIGPHAPSAVASRGGHVRLVLNQTNLPLIEADGVLDRLPNLAAVELHHSEAPRWLAAHPNLVGLTLMGLARFDPAPLAGLTELRSVEIAFAQAGADWGPVCDWLQTLPRLRCLSLGSLHRPFPGGLGEMPALRLLHLPGGPAEETSAPHAVGLASLRTRVTEAVGGVTVTRPAYLRRLPATADPDTGVETLATWAEWGDGDGRERVPGMGPAWVALERLPFRARVADLGATLAGPGGTLCDRPDWRQVRRFPGPPAGAAMLGSDPFAHHARVVWPGRRQTLRLRVECPRWDAEWAGRLAAAFAPASVGA